METLLNKVASIETEAETLIEQTKEKHAAALQELHAREEEVMTQTRKKAQERGKEILAEKMASAEKDINAIKQHGEQSVKVVHEVAEKNRPSTITLVASLLKEEYGA